MRNLTKGVALAAVAILSASVLGACGGSSSTSTDYAATVTGQWARTSPATATTGVAYMTIEVSLDDTLVGASVDMSVAMEAQVHETVMVNGSMTMQKVDSVEIKAGTPVELKVGGYHLMLMGLAKPLVVGDTFAVTLKFTNAGDVVVQVPVLEDAPE